MSHSQYRSIAPYPAAARHVGSPTASLKRFAANIARNAFASCGLSLTTSRHFQQLAAAQAVLADVSTADADYLPEKRLGHAGFCLNLERQLAFLQNFARPEFQDLFRSLRANADINTGFNGVNYRDQGLIHNGYYPTPDAELYAAMIAQYQPVQIVEVGSGFSTRVAHQTIRQLGLNTDILVIDPDPRTDVSQCASRIEYARVEKSSLSRMTFPAHGRSILFIDSSHVTKADGDAPFLYCQVLPQLPPGVVVHIHDIFTPFDYPSNYVLRFYTEQYLLQALLANSSKFSILFSTHFIAREYASAMQAVFGPGVGVDPLFCGASFWMETVT